MTWRPQHPRDWTLRSRLIASFLGLLLITCAGIGLFTRIALNHRLIGQLDSQLISSSNRSADNTGFGGPPRRGGLGEDDIHLPPGSPLGSFVARLSNGSVTSSQLQDAAGTVPSLTTDVQQALLSVRADNKPHTVNLPELGGYRVLASQVPDGDVLISGFSLSDVHSTLTNVTLAIAALALCAVIIAGLLGTVIVRLALRPLQRVTATASRVADMRLAEGEVALPEGVPDANPHTEVGQVAVAVNRMLANVSDALNARHRSEMRVRQFVADASHELRTPLASIRGYAELTRRSREVAPPDIAHAMSRVESEAGRMTTLVEDLLLLARLDSGRPLDVEEVDLTRLAVDTLSDAHAAGPNHRWELEVPDEPVVVPGDPARLHQVLANLLANARSHTPDGTAVVLSLTKHAETATITVRDNGPGISSKLIPDIFERFARGEQSRSRTAGSTGL
ncbi:MAG: histidine kinase dimerization/phospho-acceptor domain-containing protein, partial [Jatrophihabitantaceae bacterium]